jgi:hypothetical protein
MNFEFPDVADFPENEAPAFPDDVDVSHLFKDDFFFRDDMNELRALIDTTMSPGKEAGQIISKQFNRIKKAAGAYHSFKLIKSRNDLRDSPAHSYLETDGIYATKADVSGLVKFYASQIERLKHAAPKEGLAVYDRAIIENTPTSVREVHKFMDGLGLLQAATKYRGGADMRVATVTLHVSKPGDRHHSQQFQDCEAMTSLLNLHMDPKPGILKSIIYLNEVTPENGPFKFVPGSPNWKCDEIERIFAWGNSTSNYCHTPTHREAANAFPKRFRRNAIVGRLIPDGSKLSDKLRKMEVPYHSSAANVMLFSPTFGLHRGGQCEDGMRVNLQVVLK